jgi:hypothetical protein
LKDLSLFVCANHWFRRYQECKRDKSDFVLTSLRDFNYDIPFQFSIVSTLYYTHNAF